MKANMKWDCPVCDEKIEIPTRSDSPGPHVTRVYMNVTGYRAHLKMHMEVDDVYALTEFHNDPDLSDNFLR